MRTGVTFVYNSKVRSMLRPYTIIMSHLYGEKKGTAAIATKQND